MSERTELLKRAVLTSVGATTSSDRIRAAIREAMDDLLKVGKDLLVELEINGKARAENVQNFLLTLQDEAGKRTGELEKKVQAKVKSSMTQAARDMGLATRQELRQVTERIEALEEALALSKQQSGKSAAKKKAPQHN